MHTRTLRTDEKTIAAHTPERTRRIYDFLRANPVGVLCTVTPDTHPHGSVIYYFINDDLTCHCLTKGDTIKANNIRRNRHVMLTAYDLEARTVAQVYGTASPVKDNGTVSELAKRITRLGERERNGRKPATPSFLHDNLVAFEIRPSCIRLATYGQKASDGDQKIYESLESFELNFSDDD